MRHVLVHEYFGVDTEVVWRVVEHELDALKAQISALLDRLDRA